MIESSTGWYYVPRSGDTPKGPVSFGDLQQLADSRTIVGKSLVRNQAGERWVEADDVPGLIPTNSFGESDFRHHEAIRLRKLGEWRRRIGWGAVGAAGFQIGLMFAGDRVDKVALSMILVPIMLGQLVLAMGTSDHLKKLSLPLIVLSGLPGLGAIGLFLLWKRAKDELNLRESRSDDPSPR